MSEKRTCNVKVDPQTCFVITQQNVINSNKLFFENNDLLNFSLRGIQTYEGIPKIPKDQYPIYEKDYFLNFYEYEGVPYVVLQRRPKSI